MQAIEFTSESHDGVIKIPEHYKDWFKKNFKVILLATNPPLQNEASTGTDLNRFAGSIELTEDPLEFQKRIRDVIGVQGYLALGLAR